MMMMMMMMMTLTADTERILISLRAFTGRFCCAECNEFKVVWNGLPMRLISRPPEVMSKGNLPSLLKKNKNGAACYTL